MSRHCKKYRVRVAKVMVADTIVDHFSEGEASREAERKLAEFSEEERAEALRSLTWRESQDEQVSVLEATEICPDCFKTMPFSSEPPCCDRQAKERAMDKRAKIAALKLELAELEKQ